MSQRKIKTHIAEDPAQRKALTSPLRLEIIGLFTTREALSVAEMAERMGRPTASLYYHVRLLESVGLLKRTGGKPGARREEALYRPIAERFAIPADPESGEGVSDVTKTVATAFRMAERDFEAAIASDSLRREGPLRNAYVTRVHCRVSKDELRELNRHLRSIENVLAGAARRAKPGSESDQYLSLTLALLPLRGRKPI